MFIYAVIATLKDDKDEEKKKQQGQTDAFKVRVSILAHAFIYVVLINFVKFSVFH